AAHRSRDCSGDSGARQRSRRRRPRRPQSRSRLRRGAAALPRRCVSAMHRLPAAWPHVVRAFALALAALCVAWGLATPEAVAGAAIGAVAGRIFGQLMGRSRLRLPLAALILGAALLGVALLGSVALGTEALARSIGPGRALHVVGIGRFVVL